MATRSVTITAGGARDVTAALSLVSGRSYLIEVGVGAKSNDTVRLALGADPDADGVGGHILFAGERGRVIRQGTARWFARCDPLPSTVLTATEADGCD